MATRRVLVEVLIDTQESEGGPLRGSINLDVPSFQIDHLYKPIPIAPSNPQRMGENESVVLIRGEIEEAYLRDLREHSRVIAVWNDAQLRPHASVPMPGRRRDFTSRDSTASYSWPVDCDYLIPKGNLTTVAEYLGCHAIWQQGYLGQGITIAICDTGINNDLLEVTDGWSPEEAPHFGQDDDGHGTMCGTDAKGIAPQAHLYDVGVLKGLSLTGDAIAGYEWILNRFRSNGTPQVVSNSWGLYNSAWEPDYAGNPLHPLTRKIVEAIDTGICVIFSAGNCGNGGCISQLCETDIGPGRSIWGANGLAQVITVGAANINGEWIGYSSQGPAALSPDKPDICAPSHYTGYYECDNGTSAACPLCAGTVALIRQAFPTLSVAQIKKAITETATDLCDPGWDPFSGFGMLNAQAAFADAFKLLKATA